MNFKKYGRTAQLFDYQTMSEGLVGGILNSDGTITVNVASSSWAITKYIPVAGRDFTLQRQASGGATSICLYDSNQTYITGLAYKGNGTVTVSANTDVSYIRFTYYQTENTGNIMLNEGSTALPHEPYGGSWHDTPHYIHNTSTDTITTLPADIYADGTNATVGLKGNMQQNGTPTPSNPVEVNGVGVRTENLAYDILVQDLQPVYSLVLLFSADLKPDTTYTLSFDSISGFYFYINEQVFNVKYINTVTGRNQVICTTKSALDKSDNRQYLNGRWIILKNAMNQPTNIDITNVMLNSGSTAKTYEPYGYKIPILSNSTTTPVYLGEVETTRKIKKLVLTGEENWRYSTSSQAHWIENVPNDYDNTLSSQITTVCTHYKCIRNDTGIVGMNNGDLRLYARATSPVAHELYIKDETYISAAEFKSYLAQQYANGTPVTVWYVLATEETAVVNEPLMKIGTYADTLSNISIPVTAGANTLSVGTTVQPSEVTVNYKGWHPVADVHERKNGQWT